MLLEDGDEVVEEELQLGRVVGGGVVLHVLPRLGRAEDRDGGAPEPLARDRPLETVLDHRADPVHAEGGDPLDLLADLGEGPVAQRPEVDEPLVRRPEDDGALAAPAVGVAVDHVGPAEEARARRVTRLEEGEDGAVRVEVGRLRRDDPLAAERLGNVVVVEAGRVDGAEGRVVHRESAPLDDLVVLAPVARGGVDETGAVVGRDVLAEEEAE